MPARIVICTLGETWPMGQVLRGPLTFNNPIPYYGSLELLNAEAHLDLVQEGDEFVVYSDLEVPESMYISCGIKTEVNDKLEMVDATLVSLFLAPKAD